MLKNENYATHFPLFYLLASATRLAGFQEYPEWVGLWRYIFLGINLAIATLLFYLHYQADQLILAMFVVPFWLLNRWSLYVGWIAHVDFITIFLLLVSLVIFEKRMWLALLLFSLSLAIKHLAIFMVPVYLIWVWQISDQSKFKKVAPALLIMGSIPAVSSIPFLMWHLEAFVKSIIFSVTREPAGLVPPSLDVILEIIGFSGRIPIFVLMGLLYLAVAYRQIGKYASFLLIMFVFINFSPVLFPQYHTWVVPFLSISISAVDKIPGLNQTMEKTYSE